MRTTQEKTNPDCYRQLIVCAAEELINTVTTVNRNFSDLTILAVITAKLKTLLKLNAIY